MTETHQLSRRERQIMDILYQLEEASARDVQSILPDAPSYSAVRTHLRTLVEKGHIRQRESGPRYIYSPQVDRKAASRSALSGVVSTFFRNSPYLAVNSLLDMSIDEISDEELEHLDRLIRNRKKEKRKNRGGQES